MKGVILQPGYLPWLGFFDQMAQADVFVVYDDVQFTRRDWRSRNRIKTPSGIQWLTVPVKSKGRRHQLITEAEIDNSQSWSQKHIKSLRNAYAKAPYFKSYCPAVESILTQDHFFLLDLNMDLIRWLRKMLNIKTDLIHSSGLKVEGKSSERLVNICHAVGIDEYLTGDVASGYLDLDMFAANDIRVLYHHYNHPQYPQINGGFVPYLSVLDLIFNCGNNGQEYFQGR